MIFPCSWSCDLIEIDDSSCKWDGTDICLTGIKQYLLNTGWRRANAGKRGIPVFTNGKYPDAKVSLYKRIGYPKNALCFVKKLGKIIGKDWEFIYSQITFYSSIPIAAAQEFIRCHSDTDPVFERRVKPKEWPKFDFGR